MSGYKGANPSINRTHSAFTFLAMPQSEEGMTNEREKMALTLEAMTLYRNNAILRSAVDKIVSISLGSQGLMPQAKTGSKELNSLYEAYFTDWAKTCDVRGRSNFRSFQEFALMARLLTGDILFLKYPNFKLQAIEGERIVQPEGKGTPKTTHGVETDALGQIQNFYVAARNERGRLDARKTTKVSASDSLFLSNVFRPDQVRGYATVAPVLPLLMDLDRFRESVLRKAILESQIGVVTKTTTPIIQDGLIPTDDATGEAAPKDEKKFEYHTDLNNYYLQAGQGEEVELSVANYPGSNFEPFIRFLIQEVSAGLGIPDTILLSDFSSTKVTSNKALLQQFYETINKHQQWLIDGLVIPVWEWVIGSAIIRGELPAPANPKDFKRIEVSRPERLLGDPLKEVMADEKEYTLGTTSLTRKTRANGYELEDILGEKKTELVMAHRLAEEANKEAGSTVFTFKDFISVGVQQNITTNSSPTSTS